ncbi:MAG: DPP IV N-terminal domain-containing protein [bacterium]|nr:DPP IV N-terminal domain-containing protein [bacterium]
MSVKTVLRLAVCGLLALLAGPASAYNHPELNWRMIETGHFRVLYHQGEEDLAREGSRVAEEIYPRVTGYYGYEPAGKTAIIFQDTDDEAYGESSYFQNTILITATSLDLLLRGRVDWLKNVITHEFTHLVSLELADRFGPRIPLLILSVLESGSGRGRPGVFRYLDLAGSVPVPGSITPSWFSEGAAQAGSTRFGSDFWDSYRNTFLRASWLEGKVMSLDEMGALSGKDAWEGEQVYNQGFSICRYLEGRYGPGILRDLAREQGRGWHFNFGNTVRKVSGRDLPAVYAEWRKWLSEEYGKELEGITGNETAGEKFAGKGRLNLFPRFSPDGEWIAYVSSGNSDFLTESLVITTREKGGGSIFIAGGVNSGAGFSPDGKRLVYSRDDLFDLKGNHFSDLYVYDLEESSEMKITDGLRASNPVWSPDGTKIAFINNEGGDRNLWLLDLSRDQDDLAPLTGFAGGSQIFSPVFSPSGDLIAFGILKEGNEEIYSVDLSGKVQPLVSGPANERDPAWVNGSRLLYSSDEGGIFNLFELDLTTGEKRRLTRVKTGAFMPAPDPQGEGVVYSYFTTDGFRIYQMQVAGSQSQVASKSSSQIPSIDNLRPAAQTMLPEKSDLPQHSISRLPSASVYSEPVTGYLLPATNVDRPYHFTLLPPLVFPELVYEDDQGFRGGAVVALSDLLDKHTLTGEFLFGESQDYTLQYVNRQWHPTFFLEGGFHQHNYRWDEKRTRDIDGEQVGVKDSYDLSSDSSIFRVGPWYVWADSFLSSPFYRLRILNAKGKLDEFNDQGELIGTGVLPLLREQCQQVGLILGHSQFSPVRDWEAHPRGGREVTLIYSAGFSNFNREVGDLIEAGKREYSGTYNDYRFQEIFFNWNENLALPLDSALEANLALGFIDRDVYLWDEFYAGGSMEFVGMGEFRTLTELPGYPAFNPSLRGERLGIIKLSYRIPVLNVRKQVGIFYFNRVYLSLFGDAGNIINLLIVPHPGLGDYFDPDRILTDLGAEIRISSNIFYAYPWGTFIRLAHGFRDPEKEPVRIYLGIGTGF